MTPFTSTLFLAKVEVVDSAVVRVEVEVKVEAEEVMLVLEESELPIFILINNLWARLSPELGSSTSGFGGSGFTTAAVVGFEEALGAVGAEDILL